MNVHLKSVNGLQSNLMIFNYHIRNEDDKDKKIINKILDLRRLEIREKLEMKQLEMLPIEDIGSHSQFNNHYRQKTGELRRQRLSRQARLRFERLREERRDSGLGQGQRQKSGQTPRRRRGKGQRGDQAESQARAEEKHRRLQQLGHALFCLRTLHQQQVHSTF